MNSILYLNRIYIFRVKITLYRVNTKKLMSTARVFLYNQRLNRLRNHFVRIIIILDISSADTAVIYLNLA